MTDTDHTVEDHSADLPDDAPDALAAALGDRFETWPPTDVHGTEYPIDWFNFDDLDASGKLSDDRGRQFNPFAGNLSPDDGRCNAPLTGWKDRYPSVRFCNAYSQPESEFCFVHKSRESLSMRAEEVLQHGFFTKTASHLYDKLPPWEKVLAHGLFESLMGDSRFEFAPEYETKEIDFAEADFMPGVVSEEDTVLDVECPYPTDNGDRAVALWNAAMDSVKMMKVQQSIVEGGEGVDTMESKSTEHADFTSSQVPGEGGGEPKAWQTIEEVQEHHLNLPYSRLVRDRKELLKYGGVAVDGETHEVESTTYDFGDLDIVEPDPAEPTVEGETANIREHAGDDN